MSPYLMAADIARVQYHQLLGSDILGKSPKVDIMLLQREGAAWTDAQRARIPDGICDSTAAHVLVDLKYTESVTARGMIKLLAYDFLYRRERNLSEEQTLPVLLSARTPRRSRLDAWRFEETQQGVFRTSLPDVERLLLLALNRLPATSNNAMVKLFASRDREREAAFAALDRHVFAESQESGAYVLGLRHALNGKGELDMAETLTPEKVMEYGKRIRDLIIESGTPEERLAGLSPDERLTGLNSAERRELLRLLQEEFDGDDGGENS